MGILLQKGCCRLDVIDITSFIARDNPDRAASFVRELQEEMIKLADSPGMGRPRSEIRKGLRSFPFRSYLIFYDEIPEGIVVARVVHGSRRIRKAFFRQ